jgi:hypothetical protein
MPYRQISDYYTWTGTNQEVYWSQTSRDHLVEGLPKSFSKELFDAIDEWFGCRLQITPLHVWDLMNPLDWHYEGKDGDSEDEVVHLNEGGDEDSKEPIDISDSSKAAEGTWSGIAFCSPSFGFPATAQSMPPSILASTASRGKTSPLLVSSSNTIGSHSPRWILGSIGIRRRSAIGHVALVEAMRTNRKVMVNQMRNMTEASKETERNKLEVQVRLFTKQMAYQHEKERRLYEQGLIAAEKARLAIAKQGELVAYLVTMSSVLSTGLKVSSIEDVHGGGGWGISH